MNIISITRFEQSLNSSASYVPLYRLSKYISDNFYPTFSPFKSLLIFFFLAAVMAKVTNRASVLSDHVLLYWNSY